ncbi:MAG: GNAT family N-acetyltransferase [Lachnospiraceae bacterium]|nr:GNAT family N-acetyltransferase [Lachnospiraceae bacterium]
MVIETKRLILREMTEADFDALYKVLSDTNIMQHYPYTFDEARVRDWIHRNMERYRQLGFGLWAVCLKGSGEMIGDCGLTMQMINGQIRPEIGYHIRADYQRNGYATEAAIAVRDWTFANTPFCVIYSYMKHTNTPSMKTAMAYGCKLVDEYEDEINEITKVFAVDRKEIDIK